MSKTFDILVVEDNPDDVHLIREALAEGELPYKIHVAEGGTVAMDYLSQAAPFENARLPDLILLDLNLPGKDGRQVLAEIKTDARWSHIPVIVLTSSQAEEDVLKTYNLHANGFIQKPSDLDGFLHAIRKTSEFWFSTSTLPAKI